MGILPTQTGGSSGGSSGLMSFSTEEKDLIKKMKYS